jgi:acyl-CoA dehydrogenase
MNCSAPDTGNMEVLERVGTPEQKERWLKPLLNGEIRSAYAMTEPDRASSDAKQHQHSRRARRRRVGHQRREVLHLGRRRPALQDHDRHGARPARTPTHKQQSQILVPMDTPGVEILGACRCSATTTRRTATCTSASPTCACPREHAAGRRPRLRDLAAAPRARAASTTACAHRPGRKGARPDGRPRLSREGFGKKLDHLGGNMEIISRARIEIEAMRLMVLKAAKAMDTLGNARGPRVGAHGQGDGARTRLRDHRRGHPDARRHRHLAVDAAGRMYAGSARCAWPTAPTRSTTWWSAATNCSGAGLCVRQLPPA